MRKQKLKSEAYFPNKETLFYNWAWACFRDCFVWFLNGGSISLLAPSTGPRKGVQDFIQGDRERSMRELKSIGTT
jgi:hypothetical protein